IAWSGRRRGPMQRMRLSPGWRCELGRPTRAWNPRLSIRMIVSLFLACLASADVASAQGSAVASFGPLVVVESPAPQPIRPAELPLDEVVREVLARNPSLQQMAAAQEAAAARYPQAISRDDPMLSTMLAPASLNSRDVDPGYRIEFSQKLQWPGKRRLRG